MKQQSFERLHGPEWESFRKDLAGVRKREPDIARGFVSRYRRVCQQLALARDRVYGAALVLALSDLVRLGHEQLYRPRHAVWRQVGWFVAAGFPQRVRAERSAVALAVALFFGSLVGMTLAVLWRPEIALTVLDAGQLRQMEAMYHPAAEVFGRERGSDSDFVMFGFYIRNNIGIAFQTFAGGVVFGLGTLFYLLFNGLFIGAVAGHLLGVGFASTFGAFVVGHGAFELTAIAIAGAAGLRLGHALLAPGRATRGQALRRAARPAVELLLGATLLLLIAAFVEAFWSSTSWVPPASKFAVGALLWFLVLVYLFRGGRSRAA